MKRTPILAFLSLTLTLMSSCATTHAGRAVAAEKSVAIYTIKDKTDTDSPQTITVINFDYQKSMDVTVSGGRVLTQMGVDSAQCSLTYSNKRPTSSASVKWDSYTSPTFYPQNDPRNECFEVQLTKNSNLSESPPTEVSLPQGGGTSIWYSLSN